MHKIKLLVKLLIPYYKSFVSCRTAIHPALKYRNYLKYRLFGSKFYWPKDPTCLVANSRKIFVGKNSLVGRPGSYIQGAGGVYIGNYVRFAPNVGILSANHDLYDQRRSVVKPIRIGDYCWIGMGSIVLAGVELGPRTIVGANSVVTKSFPCGYCVIAGNPAKIVKHLNREEVVEYKTEKEYYGYVPEDHFEKKRSKYIDQEAWDQLNTEGSGPVTNSAE